jgi:hypothetical protein
MTNSSDRVEIITSVQRRRRGTAPEKVRIARQPDRGRQRGRGRAGRAVRHQPTPGEQLVWGNAMPTSHHAYRHTRLEGLFDRRAVGRAQVQASNARSMRRG